MPLLRSVGLEIGAALPTIFTACAPASWPDGRCGKGRKAAVEESPGSMETRCRVTPGGGDPRESATESKPPPRPPGPGGKGERVRQERTARAGNGRGTVNPTGSKTK